MKQIRFSSLLGTVLFFAMFAFLTSGCGREVGEELVDVTKPSPYVAETPEQALALFFEGIFEGNLAKAKSGIVAGDGVVAYLESNISINRAMNDFAKADRKHFGDDEKAAPVDAMAKKYREDLKRIKVVLVDESHAIWPLNPNSPMQIVKSKIGWQVDMNGPEFKEVLVTITETFGEMAEMYSGLTTRIEKGEFDSRDAVRQAMKELLE